MNIVDQDGYELVKRPRKFAHLMPDIFAVDADVMGSGALENRLSPHRQNQSPPGMSSPKVRWRWVSLDIFEVLIFQSQSFDVSKFMKEKFPKGLMKNDRYL